VTGMVAHSYMAQRRAWRDIDHLGVKILIIHKKESDEGKEGTRRGKDFSLKNDQRRKREAPRVSLKSKEGDRHCIQPLRVPKTAQAFGNLKSEDPHDKGKGVSGVPKRKRFLR